MAGDGETTEFGAALQAAAAHWRESLRRDMAARGLAAAAGTGGDILGQLGPTPTQQSALTARLGLSKQAVQQQLDQLESVGLVRREPDPADKRAKQVVLTEAGRNALVERHAVNSALDEALRDKLGKKLFKKLRKTLREISA